MIASKLEFLVDWGVNGDKDIGQKIVTTLRNIEGVQQAEIEDDALLVESTLPASSLLRTVENISGRRTVLQGFGEKQSAVCQLGGCCGEVGVVRLQQGSEALVVDGTVDGLTRGRHALRVHEAGDLSEGCQSLGAVYGGPGGSGELGVITADESGRSVFRLIHQRLKLSEIIGRSLAITATPPDESKNVDWSQIKNVCCGIIARCAPVLGNPKRVCACDGVVVWEERDAPAAGRARSRPDASAQRDRCCKQHSNL